MATRSLTTGTKIWMAGPAECKVPTAAITPKEAVQRYVTKYYGPAAKVQHFRIYKAGNGPLEGQAVVTSKGRCGTIYATQAVLV